MALSELEAARVRRALDAFMDKRRPPPAVRAQFDLGFRVSGQSVQIFELRPEWRGAPGATREHPVAKATFVRSRGEWRIFWMRRDLKWHSYEPAPSVHSIEEFCRIVEDDAYACFFG